MKMALVGLVCLFLGLAACHRKGSGQPVVVHVYRNPSGPVEPWLSRRIRDFEQSTPDIDGGRPILIATAEPRNYSAMLPQVGTSLKPEIVILDAATDADVNSVLKGKLKTSVDLCPRATGCPSFVAPWAQGDNREAAERFLAYLASRTRD
jgi:hypothetical protein